jgi:hypothetical protein
VGQGVLLLQTRTTTFWSYSYHRDRLDRGGTRGSAATNKSNNFLELFIPIEIAYIEMGQDVSAPTKNNNFLELFIPIEID